MSIEDYKYLAIDRKVKKLTKFVEIWKLFNFQVRNEWYEENRVVVYFLAGSLLTSLVMFMIINVQRAELKKRIAKEEARNKHRKKRGYKRTNKNKY